MIALYARVSRAGGDGLFDGSIAGQALVMEDYLQRMAASDPSGVFAREDAVHFADEGFSGLTLERPALRDLLVRCAAGEVSCIVVKDLSRLSRSYLDVGELVERVFPLTRTRFVSIAEGIDIAPGFHVGYSADAALGRNLIAVLNNAYSIQLSRSERASMRASWQKGCHVQAFVPFGYEYDKDARGHMRPDPVAAPIVQSVFSLAADGATPGEIASELNERGVPTPAGYAKAAGGPKAGCYGDGVTPWNARKVRTILEKEAYAGTLVAGVRRNARVGRGSPRATTPPHERVCVPNAHEPLVSRELFEAARAAVASRRTTTSRT